MRVGLSVLGSMWATLETWIEASFSTMPPALPAEGRVCRFTMLMPSTTTRFSAGSTRFTSPVLPRSRPVMTTTLAPFLILSLGMAQSTSGANETIFMNLRARSSRVTGPKMRVPIGSPCLVISTAALRSKRIALPSGRRISFAVRTITAWCTSPFLTRPRGIASLTETTMTSPTVAVLRFEPPSTLMHWTRRAPELSATSRLVCIWIMTGSPFGLGAGRGLFLLRARRGRLGRRPSGGLGLRLAHRLLCLARRRRLHAVEQSHPALAPRDRAALLDADHVARLDVVVLVMRRVVLRAHDELLVDGVHDAALDTH